MEFLTTDFLEKMLDAEINAILSTGIEVKKKYKRRNRHYA